MLVNRIENVFSFRKSALNFKGINDIDPSKTKEKYVDLSHQYSQSYVFDVSLYNSNNQILKECSLNSSNGFANFAKLNEYEYHDNGKLKTMKKYDTNRLPFYNIDTYKISHGQFPDSQYYKLTEYDSKGKTVKELSKTEDSLSEKIYNCGNGIARKDVEKPCSIDGVEYSIVELFFRNVRDTKPFRILGKDYWGEALIEIKDFAILSKIKRGYKQIKLK